MPEVWVRPPLVGEEVPPRWRSNLLFRLVLAGLLVVLIVLCYEVYQEVSGANAQDPGLTDIPDARPATTVMVPQ